MTLIVFLLSALTFAQEIPPEEAADVPSAEIIVEAHKDYEVYIAPVDYRVADQSYSIVVPDHMVFNYASMHADLAKVQVHGDRPIDVETGASWWLQHSRVHTQLRLVCRCTEFTRHLRS